MSAEDIQRSLGRIEGAQTAMSGDIKSLQSELQALSGDVTEIKTNCSKGPCKPLSFNPVVGAGVAGGGLVSILGSVIYIVLQMMGKVP